MSEDTEMKDAKECNCNCEKEDPRAPAYKDDVANLAFNHLQMIAALEARVSELEKKIAALSATPENHYHYHYDMKGDLPPAYNPGYPVNPYPISPSWPDRPNYPIITSENDKKNCDYHNLSGDVK